MSRLRLLSLSVVVVALTACADAPSAPLATSRAAFASGSGGGGGGGGVATPEFYTGSWWQTPPQRTTLLDGAVQEITIQLQMTQKGTKIDGTARRYLTTYDNLGNLVLQGFDLGSPGKITGSVTATGLSLGVRGLGEAKSNVGYVLDLSADSTTLVNRNPGAFGPQAFAR